jgi:hypothetical protein
MFRLSLRYLATRFLFLLLAMGSLSVMANGKDKGKSAVGNGKPLDIVFCVDLSGSTNGLINDLRDNLWMIINQAQHMEPKPALRIGVVGFSRPSFGKENAYVKILVPLTPNFDFVVSELYKLKPSIEKGDQIVSAALRACVNDMKWTDRSGAVKLVYLVGNGMVGGADMQYVKYCEQARENGIVIHSLYVMKSANWFKELIGWRRIATITGGMQSEVIVNKPDNLIVFPSVKGDLKSINDKYNATFLWSGIDSVNCRHAMEGSDSGAFYATPDAFLNRLYLKSSENYKHNYNDCDIVANSTLLSAEIGGDVSSAYQLRLKELFQAREQIRIQMQQQFSKADLDAIQKQYTEGTIADSGVLHRCVLNILYRAWGLR